MDYKLEDIVDIPLLQELQDKLNVIYSFPSAIIDNEGKILTAVAWQDICTKFHRINPESEKECIKSDQYIMDHLSEANPAVSYQCPHGMIDNATPIIIDGKHLGNFFTGQFFLDKPDLEFFKKQAIEFGFNEKEYLEAVAKVPIWNKEKLIHYLDFIKGFIEIIAGIGLKNLKEIEAREELNRINKELASAHTNAMNLMKDAIEAKKALEITNRKLIEEINERKKIEKELQESNQFNLQVIKHAQEGIIVYDKDMKYQIWNPFMEKLSGLYSDEVIGRHPLDLFPFLENTGVIENIHGALKGEIKKEIDFPYNLPISGKIGWTSDTTAPLFNAKGEIIGAISIVRDITDRKRSEFQIKDALIEAERFRNALDHVNANIYIKDKQSRYVYANKSTLKLFGRSLEELVGCDDTCFFPIETVNLLRKIDSRVFRGEQTSEEIEFQDANGERRVYLEIKTPIYEQSGSKSILYLLGISTDITERKRSEEALRKSEQEFHLLAEAMPQIVWITDSDGLNIYFNQQWVEYTGLTLEESYGHGWNKPFHPEDQQRAWDAWQKVTKYGSEYSLECRLRRKDGVYNWWLIRGVPQLDECGIVKKWFGTCTDINKLKQYEENLHESKTKLESALNSMTDAIFISNLEGEFIDFNESFATFHRFKNKEECARNLSDYRKILDVFKDNGELVPYEMWAVPRALRGEIVTNAEYTLRLKNTGETWIGSYSFSPIRNSDNVTVGSVVVCRDITERKKSEKDLSESHRQLEKTLVRLEETQRLVSQQERMRSLGQLASGIAHDINNSLTPIMGYVDLLTDDEELMKRNGNSIRMILKSTRNIARTIGRLKEFYKIKLTDEDLVRLDINKIVNTTIELTKHRWKDIAESTGSIIEIKKDFEDNLPLIKVDEGELIEAMMNIILNACDAMPGGGVLSFKTYQKNDKIIVLIKDTGYGMDQETLKRCIDPFFTTKGEKGTGLGLAMVYGVVERHKGVLNIESERDKGTSISLILPINKDTEEEKIIDIHPSQLKPLTILVVEDDLYIIDMLKNMLERKSHKVVQASDGQMGLELYKKSLDEKKPFDLVITDLGMPGLDGSSLSKEIKQITAEIPIILLTGWGILIDKDEYPSIDYLLKKPILQEDLFKAINFLFKDK